MRKSRIPVFLLLEFTILCIGLPTLVIACRLAPQMFLFLWGAAIYCWFTLRKNHPETISGLWGWQAVTWKNLRPILIRWVFASVGMLVFLKLYDPDRLFFLLEHNPKIVPFLLVLYPILSALPQEFIFCSFFFSRYARFFQTDRAKILASAVVFAYAHVLFINPVAPVLSFIGGLIFARTYAQHKSLALVTIEHGLYGNALFMIGLGWYFWHGAVGQG